ncbi:hypothetical protein K402DRAFT_421480 [Aulographum hederae CBS 113979]|uniref:Btz domain-containing protein n=1 Tax=Aulographum hederae CBS 113979 TaxID=1176131 RepID=A0A6G1GZN5_9PEZI|nr:hypothetical protein K402DRAFT_421480 [Aulographum hederae CBS 113979]
MPPARPRGRRDLMRSRRRVDEEGEEEGSVAATDLAEESQSDASVRSDLDEAADADDSDLSETDAADSQTVASTVAASKPEPKSPEKHTSSEPPAAVEPAKHNDTTFATSTDTDAMMNGLKLTAAATAETEGVDFENTGEALPIRTRPTGEGAQPALVRQESFADRKRREHEEYKSKRDSDPKFIPTRGNFFMHDQRSASPGQNGLRGSGRGRGRGRGAVGGPFSPANLMAQATEATSSQWTHDLHETVAEPQPKAPALTTQSTAQSSVTTAPPLPQTGPRTAAPPAAPPVRSFSKTTIIGNVQVRVSLPLMKAPVVFTAVPFKSHTRLPNHRPPLRRDKPVRISLPDHPPRYIFPATDRSFIFIPRALRPNQQFGRGRGRSGFGSYGGLSSRRTSIYGGSVYSPSIAMSRRSSLARDYPREGLISPSGSVLSHHRGQFEGGQPVVRLPPRSQQHTATGTPTGPSSTSGGGTPIGIYPPQTYPLPQKPTFRENWPTHIPMHQPRPQKTVSVAGIESPGSMTFHAPQQQEQQPFHQQVPLHMNGQPVADPNGFYPHARQLSYPSQTGGTPLSNIPERAIHAQPFQPYQQQMYPSPAGFYYQPQSGPQPQYAPGTVVAPMFVPKGQHGSYAVPTIAQPVAPIPPAPQTTAAQGQAGGLVAQEANGMVYYYDPSQIYQQPMEGYAPASYTMPGMGGMMTPTPDGFYYPQASNMPPQGAVYYPPQ